MGKSKGIIIVVIIAALIGGYYFYLSNYNKPSKEEIITEVQDVLLRDLETNYPPTPKEVIKYYSEITKCLYNEKYTDEQFEQMADKLLAIYDEQLVEKNPREQYIDDLKSDVDDFLKNGYSIASYTTSTSTDVEEYIYDGRECAKMYCTYSIKSGANYRTSKQIFVLRKETKTGHWKILGFDIADAEN